MIKHAMGRIWETTEPDSTGGLVAVAILLILLAVLVLMVAGVAGAEELTASYYSRVSLIKEGTWKNGKEKRMANGGQFSDDKLTAACNTIPLNTRVKVTRKDTGAFVVCMVTDRTNKRFTGKRIDLSKAAFGRLADYEQGTVPCVVEVVQ